MNTLLLKAAGALLLSATVLRPLVGQEPAIPESGARVRVWIPTGRIVGQLVQLSADSVILKPNARSAVRRWPREAVHRLEVSRGRRGHFWIGLATGAVVGLAAGKAAADGNR